MDTLITLIQSLGFPVAACVAMGAYVWHTSEEHMKQIDSMNAQHKEEMNSVTEAINNNTIALTRLMERMGDGE